MVPQNHLAPLAFRLFVAADDTTTVTEKVYLYDEYNHTAAGESLYTALGIKDYNNYLAKVSESQALNEVVIAVVDTGLDFTQPVFKDRVLAEYAMDFSSGYLRSSPQTWYQDMNGHGTHVAGLLADLTLPNVKILPIRIFNGANNSSDSYAFENAIRYICALKTGEPMRLLDSSGYANYVCNSQRKKVNIAAVNMSLGTSGYNTKLASEMQEFKKDKDGYTQYHTTYSGYQDVLDNLLKNDIVPIVAAGNVDTGKKENPNNSYYSLPAACDGVLSVAAYDETGEPASYSYHNDRISVAAPGSEIWSACTTGVLQTVTDSNGKLSVSKEYTDAHGNYWLCKASGREWLLRRVETGEVDEDGKPVARYYLRESGTSMATPFVSACYAMLLSDPTKTSAEDFGITWDKGDSDNYITYARKALLAAAATYGNHYGITDDGTAEGAYYEEYYGYGTVTVACFAQDDAATAPVLRNIENLIPVSVTKKTASFKDAYYTETEEDWAMVVIILLMGAIMIWGINRFRAYLIRRKTYDDGNNWPYNH